MKSFKLALTAMMLVLGFSASIAQTKPATSGKSSFNEPEPNPHGSGEYHPNQPHESTAPVDSDRSRHDHKTIR